jgi:hypothetical protein
MESATAGPHDQTGENVLKKAGILVAVAAAGVLAVAPLAFAADVDHSPKCTFANSAEAGNKQVANGFLGLLAGTGTAANAATPATTQTNAPALSCNNVSDVLDLDSNNDTKTVDNSKDINNSTTVDKDSTESSTTDITSTITGLLPI